MLSVLGRTPGHAAYRLWGAASTVPGRGCLLPSNKRGSGRERISAADAPVAAAVVPIAAPFRSTETHSDSQKGDFFGLFGGSAEGQFQPLRLTVA